MDVLLGRELLFFLFSLTFFCSFLQESDGAAVVSALRFHPVIHCFSAVCVCVCVYAFADHVQLNMYYMNTTKRVCVHACAWACLYLVSYVSTSVSITPRPPPPFPYASLLFWCQDASISKNFPCSPGGCNWSHA